MRRRITYADRVVLEALSGSGISEKEIAALLDLPQKVIREEYRLGCRAGKAYRAAWAWEHRDREAQ